ncbi:MAG TPA: M56 family metallopeptidase [Isosphaeraceae bacterium]|nr:M56 family metallopeptidase [Isosphaeraceae bacterium]
MTMTMLARLLESPTAQRLARAHLHFLWQGLVAGIIAWLVLTALRRASSGARYRVLVIVLGVLAACPLATCALIPAGPDRRGNSSGSEFAADRRASEPGFVIRIEPASGEAPAASGEPQPSHFANQPQPARVSPADVLPARDRVSPWPLRVRDVWADVPIWLERHLAWVAGGWLLGVCLLSMRLLLGWVAIVRLKRVGVRPLDGDLRTRLDGLARRLRIARPVRLLESVLAEVPSVIGWLKPVVLLPVRACTGLSSEQIEAILAHELAHIQRCDYLINGLQVVIETLLFYHPVVWWVSRAIRREREQCCDDVAVSLCGDRFVYARALTAMEALRGRAPGLAMAAGSRGSLLRRRILRLLGVPHEPAPTAARWLAAAVAMGAALTMGVGLPWAATAAGAPPAPPLTALSRDQIPAYELKVAGAADPGAASPSLVAILGNSRLKMMGYVGSLVFTADGRSLLSAGNQEIACWDPVTGEQQRVLSGHTNRVDTLAISRDGRTLVTGSFDRSVKVWDLASGQARLTLRGHQNVVLAVAISPEGTLIASADQEVRTWDISAGRQRVHMRRLGEHGRFVHGLAFSPDGRTLVSGGDDGKLKVWDIAAGRLVQSLEPLREGWRAVAFSPDGATLAAAGQEHGLVLWDTRTWTIRHKVPGQDSIGAEALAFAPDGRHLAVSLGFAARMIDVATGKEVWSSPKQPVGMNAIAVSPDGATIATSGLMIKLWDVTAGKEKTPRLAGHAAGIESVAFSPDGTTLATGSSDRTVKLWDLATRRERMTLDGQTNYVQSVAFSPDGKSLASIGFGSELVLWELPSGKRLRTWKGEGNLGKRVGFSPDGRWIAAESLSRVEGRGLTIWEQATGKLKGKIESGDGSYLFTPDSKTVIFAGEWGWSPRKRRLLAWDIEHEKVEWTIEDGLLPSQLHVSALSPDGRVIALAGSDYQDHEKGKPIVVLWGLAEKRPLYRLDQWADHLAFCPDGRTLLGVGRDGLARVWDPRNGTLRETIRVCEAGQFAIRDLAVASDSRHFAAALGNGTARIFRLEPAPETVEPREPLPDIAARPEPPIDLWKQLIGRPAPEFRAIQAWAGGPPVKLADLRGKFVLLHFWSSPSALQMVEFMALHEKFADQGLVIIALQRDWGIRSVEEWQARASRSEAWGGRALPFRIALDGGGPTPIEGTDAQGPGATHAAFAVQVSRHGWALQPVNLLIGPAGKVLTGWDSPYTLQRELEAWMGVKAKIPAWRLRFDQRYALADGQILKHVGPPYPPERSDYLLSSSRRGRADPQWSEVFRWDGRLRPWGSMGTNRLQDVLGFVLKLRRGEFDGPAELLNRPVPGDWIVRQGASKDDLLKALETILADELKQPIHFTPREVEHEVIVAAGRYQFHPLGDLPKERAVHLGTESLPSEDGGGGGSGSLREMLDWLGDRVSRLVIDETDSSKETVQWRDHLARAMNEMASGTESGRALLQRLLENVSKQTSLTFHQERRKVRVWSVSGP